MTRFRPSLASVVETSLVAAATTWVSMLSWRGFSLDSARYLMPLLGLALVVAATGAAARWWRLPAPAILAIQVVASGMVACWMLTGLPLPVGSAWTELTSAFTGALETANRYAPPVPAVSPGIHPILVACGLGCLLLVDLLACTLRRVPLAGLPLLTVYSVPLSMIGAGLSWWVFALTAAGFLGLLFLHENDEVLRWGRLLDPTSEADPSSFGVRTGAVRASATSIGAAVTGLAIVVPIVVPTLDFRLFDLGPGSGGDGQIELENPMTDLRRDLNRGTDVTLVRLRTDDPNPSYLRVSVLNRFSDNEWSSGDRDVPTDQLAAGPMPPLAGVASSIPRRTYEYDVQVTSLFESTWLPTQAPIAAIHAEGDWRYDEATMDFIAGDESLDTAGLDYSMTAVELDLDPDDLINAPTAAGAVSQEFLELPAALPGMVRELAASVTASASSQFEKAVALQEWFREEGGFTYTLDVSTGNGTDDLVAFLSSQGRQGYCEQFASAMAVMARSLGIPARVAVGFLRPSPVGPGRYEYSAWDMHAWPELFIPGSGWVAFEPTPPDRANNVPPYTAIDLGDVAAPGLPTAAPGAGQAPDTPQRDDKPTAEEQAAAEAEAAARETGFPWLPVLVGLGVVAAAVLVGLLPRTLRRRRRERRLAGTPEEAWAELRDTAVDLGLPWPAHRSPRETGDALTPHVGTARDDLARIVRTLELARYARPGTGGTDDSLRSSVEACLAGLERAASRAGRRRAAWWPRSAFRRPTTRTAWQDDVVETKAGSVVEHVG